MKSIRILIADDQKLFAESLKTVLEAMDPEFLVVGIAGDGEEALALADALGPGIVLMDVRMPRLDGVEATRQLRFRRPDLPVLMLTSLEDEEYVRQALRLGASGYMLKNILPAELVSCIRAVLNGAVSIDPRVLPGLIQGPARPAEAPAAGEGGAGGAWHDALNRKERQMLGLMVQGFSNKEIAVRLHVAEQTVRNYVSRMYEKMGVPDRGKAIARARASGLY